MTLGFIGQNDLLSKMRSPVRSIAPLSLKAGERSVVGFTG